MYLVGFFCVYWLSLIKISHSKKTYITKDKIENLLYWGMLGAIIGGRLGYVVIYRPDYFSRHLIEILYIRNGGMSFHGGLIGVLISIYTYAKIQKIPFLELTDFIAPSIPVALAAGRIGNFINGELWGYQTKLPWGIIFHNDVEQIPRHPSQIYEFLLEGVLLFIIMQVFSNKKTRPKGQVSAMFLIFYGLTRFFAEFWREPDYFIINTTQLLTLGQTLSIPMIVLGIAILLTNR
ncbi:phosphatidylglycerol:prolipoprotein diacylglycerol transferase [Candidatus Kinetoplastibacterium desouzaii TCC079E]|uniref:Phosphatidylglycerol--prolipoprotein diacylglyceryl transferase n=2 Tax=Candidatus Kinetoplastidibacterium desouzai TaxID=994692 RepID=M1LV24_9PROT|nr:phosphatidylglycerol:prolipoprotein diacylglycerol transferase [Candidatus Kinetoplastibacterium desouzaii TCC079E]